MALLLLGACASTDEPPPTMGFEERERPEQASPAQEPAPAARTEAVRPEARRPLARPDARTKPSGTVVPPVAAPSEKTVSPPPPPAPDIRIDREETQREARVTPFDQSEAPSDLEITRTIRRALMKDEALSFRAKNVVIVTEGGHVTLSGLVTSRSEADRIRAIAASIAAKDVEDRIEVHE